MKDKKQILTKQERQALDDLYHLFLGIKIGIVIILAFWCFGWLYYLITGGCITLPF